VLAGIEQPAVIRQILERLGPAVPARAKRRRPRWRGAAQGPRHPSGPTIRWPQISRSWIPWLS